MTAPYITHFMRGDEAERTTLCGRSWDSVIANERPATCQACRDQHARMTNWSFPLPEVVN
jgi:hypothetical protein